MMGGYGGMSGGVFGGMSGWAWLFWALLAAGVVLLAVLAVRLFRGGGTRGPGPIDGPGRAGPASGPATARRILDERYARGELTTEEYRGRLTVLGEDS